MTGASPARIFVTGILESQVISNVPATIILSRQCPPDKVLAWAVNVGGFGIITGSLANLIALRLSREPGLAWQFHAYSLPFLVLASLTAWWLI